MAYIVHARLRQGCQVNGARRKHAAVTTSLARGELIVPPAHHSRRNQPTKRAPQDCVRNIRIGSAKALDCSARAHLQWSDRSSGRVGGTGCMCLVVRPEQPVECGTGSRQRLQRSQRTSLTSEAGSELGSERGRAREPRKPRDCEARQHPAGASAPPWQQKSGRGDSVGVRNERDIFL